MKNVLLVILLALLYPFIAKYHLQAAEMSQVYEEKAKIETHRALEIELRQVNSYEFRCQGKKISRGDRKWCKQREKISAVLHNVPKQVH